MGGKRTLRPGAGNGTLDPMTDANEHLAQASHALERAKGLLAQPATLDGYEWLLVATLIVEADDALMVAQKSDPSARLPLLDEVVEELREATSNFTKAEFASAAKAPRRQKPNLFTPRR
jgi:hypothetical protein